MAENLRWHIMDELAAGLCRPFGLILWLVIVPGSMKALAQPPPIPVEVATVVSRAIQEEVSFVATLEPNIATTVGALVAGRVIRTDVREGDQVVSGKTVIIQLDRASREISLRETQAAVDKAEQDFQRAERLYRNEFISLAEFDRLRSEFLAAKARHDLVAYELDRTTLHAPLTGFLVKKYVEVGTWVNPGDPVADLVDLDPIYATGPVGERRIDLLQNGLPATVTVDALPGKSLRGTVSHIVPQADPQSRTFPVKVSIANPDGRLKSGMLARVTVKVGGGRRGFLVPKDAVVRRGADDFIFIVEDGLAREYKVKTGRAVKGLLEVYHSALKAGQEVVILGNESLSDRASVREVNRHKQGVAPRSR